MKIVLLEVEPWEAETFRHLEQQHELVREPGPLDEETAAAHADAEVVSCFIYSRLDRPVLKRLSGVKLIATRSTGVDHIDMAFCRERGIKIANVPTYGENTVAEHVFALLLTISHHMVEAVDRTRRGDFSQAGLHGFDLMGRVMGVIGTGTIGRHTARIARGFGMEVLAFDIKPDPGAAEAIGFVYKEMNAVLGAADVVSIHVPGSAKTKHLISDAEFAAMKPGAVLINTARGPVVDTRALLRALADGRVAAAGLDVLPEEPVIREEAELLRSAFSREHNLEALLADHILLRLRNVVITPHSAFNTREAVQRILDTTLLNIEGFVADRPINLVG